MQSIARSHSIVAILAVLMTVSALLFISQAAAAQSANCAAETASTVSGGTGHPFILALDRQARVDQAPSYAVGESTTYSVNCAAVNAPIYWSSTLNSVSTGENMAYYGQNTDSSGHWYATAGAWVGANRGLWTKTATVNGASVTVTFYVTPNLAVNSLVDTISTPTFMAGQGTTYTISGAPPNNQIQWTSTLNNVSTGEYRAYYGQTTDANGNWTALGGAWTAAQAGAWLKTATFVDPANPNNPNPPTSKVSFQVIASCSIFSLPGSQPPSGSDFPNRVGAYDWPINRCLTDDGTNRVSAIGGHVVRVLFSAKCSTQETLSQVFSTAEIQNALTNPYLTTFVLTEFDRATCTPSYVDPNYYTTTNYNAVVSDYQAMLQQLYTQFHGKNKTFIISNWEGDSAVYCGVPFAYATDIYTRAACDANYAALYKGIPTPNSAISGLTRWLQARQAALQGAQAWANTMGYNTGIQVKYAVEFSVIHALQEPNNLNRNNDGIVCPGAFQSTLCNVLPSVTHDYASYSSYESSNVSSAQLGNDLTRLATYLGTSNLFIGEFGFSQQQFSQQQVRQMSDAIYNTALGWRSPWNVQLPYIFEWVEFDNRQYGIYDFGGQPQAMACYFENRMLPSPQIYPFGSCN
jgi:hypothetical protein